MFGFSLAFITGQSAKSSLRNGSPALFRRRRSIKRGDVVLAWHPDGDKVVRRVSAIGRKGSVFINLNKGEETGPNLHGKVGRGDVIGVMVWKLF